MYKKWAVLFATLFFTACSAKQVMKDTIDIASSNDPRKALEARLTKTYEEKKREYKEDPTRVIDDAKAAKKHFDELMAFLSKMAGKEWGKEEAKVPTKKEMVKYTDEYKSRGIIDFDRGLISVETVNMGEKKEKSLRNAIVTTLLTPDDPRSVDLFSDRPVETKGKPYLYGLVLDNNDKPVETMEEAEAYADYLLENSLKERKIDRDGTKLDVAYVEFSMVNDYTDKNANKYAVFVDKHASRFNVSKSLVFAVIKTESNFNPWAVSHAPAYGLMQLVPTSGGRDAYRKVKGKDEPPTTDYLFDPENNIELGTAYLGTLNYDYFSDVKNPVSREYCTISGYNTGRGNVLKAFSKDRKEAVSYINSLKPSSVYDRLVNNLPYEETRQYLVKVVNHRKQYATK